MTTLPGRIVLLLVAGFAASSASAVNLLVNGGFENMPNFGAGVSGDSGYSALTGAQIPGWTIESNHAATVHNTVIYPFISGNYSINMDGEGYLGNNANLYQDFPTTLGTSYTLEFDWQGWVNSTTSQLGVSVKDAATNAPVVGGTYAFSATLHHETIPFIGTGAALRLRLEEVPQSGVNDNAFIVDNFSVTAVPTPGACALLGLGGLLTSRRRR